MADLATEPRWARSMHTFGEDAELAGRLVAAYIRGFQGDQLGPESVACMTKHFPGGGPQRDGEDPHFPYGKDQIYPGDGFEYHLRVFEAAFEAGTAQIMPYYGRPVGTPYEEVGFGYNRDVITGLLRGRYGFDGVVCTDWGLITDAPMPDGSVFEAKCWGVEELSAEDRLEKIIAAGCDQLGGEALPELLVELVRAGRISEARIDESVRRLLRDKFRLGLFDDPYVDPEEAERICGCAEFRSAGDRLQRRSAVLVTNDGTLPLAAGRVSTSTVSPTRARRPTATSSTGPRTPTSRSFAATHRSSRARRASSRASSMPATSTSRNRSSASCSSSRGERRRCWCCTSSVLPSSPSSSKSARHPGRVRVGRRGSARRPVRPIGAGRAAAVRAAVVDGGGSGAEAGRPGGLERSALSLRARPLVRLTVSAPPQGSPTRIETAAGVLEASNHQPKEPRCP